MYLMPPVSLIALVLSWGVVSHCPYDPRMGGRVTYSTPSPDGKYVFVMIAPRTRNPHPDLQPERKPHEKALYEKYAKTGSGLYRNDGSTVPLWTVDWYSFEVFPANDGVHLVRTHGDSCVSRSFPATKRLPDDVVAWQVNAPALSFYTNGKPIRTYSLRELVQVPESLPHTLYHVLWMSGGVFTEDGRQFGLITQEPRQLYFDLDTGRIVIDRPAGLGNAQVWVVRISLALTGFAAVVILAGWLYRQRK